MGVPTYTVVGATAVIFGFCFYLISVIIEAPANVIDEWAIELIGTPYHALLYTFFLALASKIPLMFAMAQEGRGYNNVNPRSQQSNLSSGWSCRAKGAHYNTLENAPLFGIGILAGIVGGVDSFFLIKMSFLWLATRVLYICAYLANLDTLRSISWVFSTVVTVFIYQRAADANAFVEKLTSSA